MSLLPVKRLFLVPMLAALLGAPPAWALDMPGTGSDAPVSIDAGSLSYDKSTDTFNAAGGVHLHKGPLELSAETMKWDRKSGEATAAGRVRLVSPEAVLEGEDLRYNLETGLGRVANGRVNASGQNFQIAGAIIEKLGEHRYRVSDGTFTTCEGDPPAWKFAASRLDVTLGGYARARNVLFYLRDVPVLYIPYLIYPAKTERESGMLLPRYGYSSRRGTQFSLAWYQAIARNLDATLELDYLSKFGLGTGLEYRYILGEESEGTIHGYHVFESGRTDRYALDGRHRGVLPGKVRLTADLDFVSSRDYFRDFGESYEIYTRDKAKTVVALARNWDKLNLSGQFQYLKDLAQKTDGTLQRLPEVRLAAAPQRLGSTPLLYQIDGESDYFWRREGTTGGRLSLHPALLTDLFSNPWFDLLPQVGYRERLYETSDGFAEKGIFDLGARVSSQFARVFVVDGATVRRIRHSLEPELTYSFLPRARQDDLPSFDSLDRIGPESRLGYALTNRFTARLEPENGDVYYHEYLYLRLSQNYDFREADRVLDLNSSDSRKPFSPLLLEMVVRPNRWSYIDLDTSYEINAGENRLIEFNMRGALTDKAGNQLDIDFRHRSGEIKYLATNLTTSLLKPVYVKYSSRYDFKAGKALENVLGFEYRARCWSAFVTYRERPNDQGIMLSFSLSGLGRVAGFGPSQSRSD